MKMLLLNALKGLRYKKVQMLGIIFMVLLSTAVYTGMNSSVDRLEDKYYSYLEDQKVEHIAVDISMDYLIDNVKPEQIYKIIDTKLKNISKEEKQTLLAYAELAKNPSFNVELIYGAKTILDKYDALADIEKDVMDDVAKKYNFTYDRELSKTVHQDNKIIKVIPYNKDKKLNKVYLVKGKLPSKDKEITILEEYARNNKIKINDSYKINETNYKVVGYTAAPDYIYPLVSLSMPIYDAKNNDVVYMYKDNYKNVKGVNDNCYSIYYNGDVERKFSAKSMTGKDSIFKVFEDKRVSAGMSTILRLTRIGALQGEFASDRLFAKYFMELLLAISVIIIVVITKKRIEDERLQIGVLKSLGYNRFKIAVSYLVYPVVGTIIGGILGFLLGAVVSEPISTVLRSYYAVPLSGYKIDLNYLSYSVFVPMIVLSLLSFIIAFVMLRKKPLNLLREGSNLKVNFFSKLTNKITRHLPFSLKMKYSLAFRSLGKLFIVTVTSFLTGLLITLILIGMNLFNNLITKTFEGTDHKYIVYLNGIQESDKKYKDTDYVLQETLELDKVTDKNKKLKDKYKEQTITFTGIDKDVKYVKLLDSKKKKLNNLLDNNSAVISKNLSESLNIKVGDTLYAKYRDLEFSYKVAGITEDYISLTAYVSRESLAKRNGLNSNSFSLIYSNNDRYKNMSNLKEEELTNVVYMMNLEDLKDNIERQMDRFNGSIYIVIFFASLMVFIIIAVIANIVVEENKRTISLMKVLGYKNKSISNIILNIYTPFIIIAYIISIPVMVKILKLIVKALVGDTKITIPIEADPLTLFIGLVGLLVAYYIALFISKKALNKIPLSVALKRE